MASMKGRGGSGGLFIPGGLLTGMGFGFVFDNVPAGMFIGLGLGFVLFAIAGLIFGFSDNKKEE